ncbi:MAG: FAD-dependent oxidoreductase [Oscillospiraceae bacterium]|nr:FAD-dependent oxidoreductase [Oscillospiraceae bacterium]
MYDIIIIGGGPAGLTAAVYARRAGKSVLVLEKAALGGQITWSPKVENFPSVVSISGGELGDRMAEQAMAQGADIELEEVVGIDDCGGYRRVRCDFGASYEGRAVILAVGAKPRMLGLEREEELVGAGVGYCAVCDGAFFKGLPVAVNGGGNSALQDAMLLSETSCRVYLIHRRASFRGEEKLVEALRAKDNVEFVLNASIKRLLGGDELKGIVVEQNGAEREIAVDGLFVAIGHEPDNTAFAEFASLDERGYAASGEDCLTKTPWLFAAGDCRAKKVHQLTTAVADGAVAALAACAWLDR